MKTSAMAQAGWILAAFLAGWLFSGARSVRAQGPSPSQIEIRGLGSESHMIVHYPEERRVYVYNNAFTGAPKRACAYFFRLGNPGEPIRRELCPNDMSDR